jgi:hypothetical protein
VSRSDSPEAATLGSFYVRRHCRHTYAEKPLHYFPDQPATEPHPLIVPLQKELVQLSRYLVVGSKYPFGEADQGTV